MIKILQFFKNLFKKKKPLEVTVTVFISGTGDKKVKRFIVPVGGKSKKQATKALSELMKQYKEEINWDDDDRYGRVVIDGTSQFPYKKEIWLPNPRVDEIYPLPKKEK